MRNNIVAGNWKMNLTRDQAKMLVEKVLSGNCRKNIEVIFAPSFINLYKIAKMCSDHTSFSVAAQDCSANKKGAFTGEVSASMISSCNAKYVILGHSERRLNFNESNDDLKAKISQVLSNNLEVIFCCGESVNQRKESTYFDWIESQLSESLFHLSKKEIMKVVIAYEPIWAIGTGMNASPEIAQEMHAFIRGLLSSCYGTKISENISILYGGSCNAENAQTLFKQKDIDGGLIGGASLNPKNFLKIINSF